MCTYTVQCWKQGDRWKGRGVRREDRRGRKWKWMWPPSKIHVYVNVGVTTVYMYCLDHHYYEVFSHAYLHVQCTCTRALLHTTRVLVHMHTRIWMNGCYSVSIRNAHKIHIIGCVVQVQLRFNEHHVCVHVPTSVTWLILAPASNSVFTTSRCPSKLAPYNGLQPFCNTIVIITRGWTSEGGCWNITHDRCNIYAQREVKGGGKDDRWVG